VIERIRFRAAANAGNPKRLRLGIGDDCAILRPPSGHDLLVTTDFSLEGRHFRRDWHSPASAGHRTLARGLSDLAAMGATPLAAFLSLALPRSIARNTNWLDGFLDGLLALAREHGVPLAGGDTTESPGSAFSPATRGKDGLSKDDRTQDRDKDAPLLADIVLLGSAPRGQALRRSGARPGDILYCTGSLGGAAAELASLEQSPRRFHAATALDDHPHLFPKPRIATGEALLKRHLATACIDISDGLSTDLAHLCEASGVSAELHAASLPLHPLAQKLGPAAALQAALHGGEDYELLFTAHPSTRVPRKLGGVPLNRIGRVGRVRPNQPQMTLIAANGMASTLTLGGWEHLR
jgi:thiamine-monophosphate kinase